MKKLIFILILVAGVVLFFHYHSNFNNTEIKSEGMAAASTATVNTDTATKTTTTKQTTQKILSADDILKLADNKYADGVVPLGDNKYVTTAPKAGYVYLCNVHKDNPGSMVNGPWISGNTWNFLKKVAISGAVSWPNAKFTSALANSLRTFSGNGLPVSHTTGVFPVAQTDPAHAYDANPNTISSQTLKLSLPQNPTYSETPNCMGGEVGIMLSGVPLFNAFDAGLRDAPAHEEQDSCEGHPQGSGEYHYHSLSNCFKDTAETTVIGYALDGFPITGPKVAKDKYLTTEDLDICHGITSEITVDGKKKIIYHYVMTYDFPYSASCFRGKPAQMQVIQGMQGQMGGGQQTPPGMPPRY